MPAAPGRYAQDGSSLSVRWGRSVRNRSAGARAAGVEMSAMRGCRGPEMRFWGTKRRYSVSESS